MADSNFPVQVKEDMTFEASYLFVKFGSVRFQMLGDGNYNGLSVCKLRAYVDSYSGIPFVNFHAVYETYVDPKTLLCLFNLRKEREGDSWVYTTTNLDFGAKKIEWKQFKDGEPIKILDLPLDTTYSNGVSFVYYLRGICRNACGKRMHLEIPFIDDTVRSSVSLTINEKKESCDAIAFDSPVEAYRLSGHLNFTGTFGISGDFIGWMSADSAAVPLKGDVKVLIGNVVVQLKEIKRENWSPPKSMEGD